MVANDGVANVTYADLDGVTGYTQTGDVAYYLENQFFVKSSGEAIAIGGGNPNYDKVAIKAVTVSGLDATGALDKALRI